MALSNKKMDLYKQKLTASENFDFKAYQEIVMRYGKVLETTGLNVADHTFANAFYYNKTGMNFADPSQVGKTLIFVTRPDCNWAMANLNAVPFFDWFIQGVLGRQCASMLTHPHRLINHKYSEDDFRGIELSDRGVIKDYLKKLNELEEAYSGSLDNDAGEAQIQKQLDEAAKQMKQTKNRWDNEVLAGSDANLNSSGNSSNSPIGWNDDIDYRMNTPPQHYMDPNNAGAEWFANRVLKRDPVTSVGGFSISRNFKDTIYYNSPFIPLLSNHCTECSGARDFSLDNYETESDYHGGKRNYPTGADQMNSSGEISLTFRDNQFNQIFYLMYMWVLYIDMVSRGEIMPRIENIWEKVLDYTCSIYVFVLDKDHSIIKGWAKYTGCSPRSVPMGQIVHSDRVGVDSWNQITIPFVYNHVEVMNPEIFTDFNYVAETEWRRKINPAFEGFSLWKSRTKDYSVEKVFVNITKKGASGQTPERVIVLGEREHNDESSKKELEDFAKTMPADNTIKNEHFGYYPSIDNGRFEWLSYYQPATTGQGAEIDLNQRDADAAIQHIKQVGKPPA